MLTVTYNGGALLPQVEVQAVYYGSNWATNPALYQQTGQFEGYLNYLVTSPYMDMLTKAGYNVGQGSSSTGNILEYQLSSSQYLQDGTIQSNLQAEINAGALQPNDANRLYVVYVEPNIAVNLPGQGTSITSFAGYHGAFTGSNGAPVRYAVVTTPGGATVGGAANAYANGDTYLSAFNEMTMVSSHEIAEAVTDPNINYSTLGWYDNQRNQEIGDVTNGQPIQLNGYTVQVMPDQNDNAIVPTELTLTGLNFSATAGEVFSGNVAVGHNSVGLTQASNLYADIFWGDGSLTIVPVGSVSSDGHGDFYVSGTHTYATSGNFEVSVYLHDQTNSIGNANENTTQTVLNPQPALTVAGLNFSATAGEGFAGYVAVGQDPTGLTHGYNLAANITWGDGAVTDGASVIDDGHGDYYVFGTHTYATGGNFVVNVFLIDETNWNSFATENTTVTVLAAPVYTVADFPGAGVWRHSSQSGWQQLNVGDATQVSVDSHGNVVADFAGYGVWRYEDATGWQQLAKVDASLLAIDGGGHVFADFPQYGLNEYVSGMNWKSVQPAGVPPINGHVRDASLLAVDANGDLAAEFPGAGVWHYEAATGWQQLTTGDASLLAIDGGGHVYADFAQYGLNEYVSGTTWKSVQPAGVPPLNGHVRDASLLEVDANGDVAAEFLGAGVWRLTSGAPAWQQLSTADASQLDDRRQRPCVRRFRAVRPQRIRQRHDLEVGTAGRRAAAQRARQGRLAAGGRLTAA